MNRKRYSGRAIVFGDNIDTDSILSGKYISISDEKLLAPHAFESIHGSLGIGRNGSCIIVAGKNFGCGSSREGAPLALRGCGIRVIIAESFARLFYRNAINIGLIPIECKNLGRDSKTGDRIIVDLALNRVCNLTKGREYPFTAMPPHIKKIVEKGGLINFIKKRGE